MRFAYLNGMSLTFHMELIIGVRLSQHI